jgi:hypothetical protein
MYACIRIVLTPQGREVSGESVALQHALVVINVHPFLRSLQGECWAVQFLEHVNG